MDDYPNFRHFLRIGLFLIGGGERQIQKEVMGYRQFLVRGLEAVSAEWTLLCMAFNLKKMFSLMLKDAQKTAISMAFLAIYKVFLIYIWNWVKRAKIKTSFC